MPFIDTNQLNTIERLPGWKGKYFDSESMTFGHYVFEAGSSIHEHSHANEEVWNVIEGQLEVRIDGKTQIAGPGCVAIVPPNTLHFVRAITDGRAIVVDYPLRREMSGSQIITANHKWWGGPPCPPFERAGTAARPTNQEPLPG